MQFNPCEIQLGQGKRLKQHVFILIVTEYEIRRLKTSN